MDFIDYEVLAKLHNFRKELSSIQKAGKNEHQKFKYFLLSDLFNNIVNELDKIGIFTICGIKHIEGDWCNINLIFYDIELKKSHTFSYDLPLDTQQKNRIQAGGSTWTYAYRYGLQMFFAISDDKNDPDSKDSSKSYMNNKEIKLADQTLLKKVSNHLISLGLTSSSDRVNYIKDNYNCVPSNLDFDSANEILKLDTL